VGSGGADWAALHAAGASLVSLAAGVVVVGWIVVQVSLIGLVSALQPLVCVLGLAMIVLVARSTRDLRSGSQQGPAAALGYRWGLFRDACLRKGLPLIGHAMELSARNQFKGTVKSVKLGAIMAEVVVDVAGNEIVSEITKSSVERLKLQAGDAVTVIIKSTEVMIGK
jgi:molybdopterin-binding protein